MAADLGQKTDRLSDLKDWEKIIYFVPGAIQISHRSPSSPDTLRLRPAVSQTAFNDYAALIIGNTSGAFAAHLLVVQPSRDRHI